MTGEEELEANTARLSGASAAETGEGRGTWRPGDHGEEQAPRCGHGAHPPRERPAAGRVRNGTTAGCVRSSKKRHSLFCFCVFQFKDYIFRVF